MNTDLENAYIDFNALGAAIHSSSGYYSSGLAMCAKEYNVELDDLADYAAKQWGVYPYDE
jgi:hypothetical protein